MKIQFYGCSYSDGGGIDRKDYILYNLDQEWINEYPDDISDIHDAKKYYYHYKKEFKNYFRFSNIIERTLNCEIQNNSLTANNNDNIFDQVMYRLSNKDGDIHIVQWSHFSRQKMWYENTQKFYRLQGVENEAYAYEENTDNTLEDSKVTNYYNNFLLHHYNLSYSIERIQNLTKLLTSYSNDNNIPIYFIAWEDLEYCNDKFIDFENLSLSNYIEHAYKKYKSKLDINYSTNGKIFDPHLSYEGNVYVANKIIDKLRQDGQIN